MKIMVWFLAVSSVLSVAHLQAPRRERLLTPQQQLALARLDQLAEQAKEIKDDRVRIRTQSRIADLLWKYDEPRARRLLTESFGAIEAIKTDAPREGMPGNPEQIEARGELLRLVAERDFDLAEKLVKSMPAAPASADPATALFGEAFSERAALHLELATQLAATNPARAAQIARSSLSSGISPRFASALLSIRAANQKLADDLFRQALAAPPRQTALPTFAVMALAPYVFPNEEGFVSFSDRTAAHFAVGRPDFTAPDPDLIKQFLNFAYQSVAGQNNAARAGAISLPNVDPQELAAELSVMDYFALRPLLPHFDQYLPEKAALIRARLSQASQDLPAAERQEFEEMFERGPRHFASPLETAAKMLERAEAERDPAQRDTFYEQAALWATNEGDLSRALSIAEKIGDESRRSRAVSSVRFQAAQAAAQKGELETACGLARELPDAQQRTQLLNNLALKFIEKSDQPRAAELIAEATAALGPTEPTAEKARSLLSLTTTAARIDMPRAFEIAKSAVAVLNQSAASPAPRGRVFREAGAGMVIGMPHLRLEDLNFDESFAPLARADFDRALGLAQTIEKKQLAIPAQLAVCRGVLVKVNHP